MTDDAEPFLGSRRFGSLRLSLIRYPGELQAACLVSNHVPAVLSLSPLRVHYVGSVIIMLSEDMYRVATLFLEN